MVQDTRQCVYYNTKFDVKHCDESSLCYFISGTPLSGTLIVLIHGTGGSHSHFDSLLPILVNTGYCVLTCDLPYHGESQPEIASRPIHPISFDKIAENLSHALETYKQLYSPQKSVNLVLGGISMGGFFVQACLRQRMSAWKALGLNTGAIIAMGCNSIHLQSPRMEWMDFFTTVMDNSPEKQQIIDTLRMSIPMSSVDPITQAKATHSLNLVHDEILFQYLVACASLVPKKPSFSSPNEFQFQDQPLPVPHILLHGDTDILTESFMSGWFAWVQENKIACTLNRIPNAGHLVCLDNGVTLAQSIVDSLSAWNLEDSPIHSSSSPF
ncbi:Alpha/Beta hydrolase protein [Spinellus fusiger]|nr:Alpha/Beta hydrolase protein [Spinellus fusiger]